MPDDIKLIPCPHCGGMPVVLIVPAWPHPALQVQCTACRKAGPWIYFNARMPIWQTLDDLLLPGLGRAREEAAAAWNEERQP